jgi:soluble lytic murein transglycosylase-like protein
MARLRFLLIGALMAVAAPANAGPPGRWAREVAEASRRFGLPEPWIRRVIAAESGGRTMTGGRPTVSSAGAMGLMQLMPATWREMRVRHGLGSNPHDPRDNILAGTAYLRAMYDRFGYPGLFAAYNAGPARYAGHLATGRRLPAETIEYVARIAGRNEMAAIGAMPRSRSPAPPARSSFAPLFAITEAIKRQPGAAVRRSRPAQGLFALLPRGGPAIP